MPALPDGELMGEMHGLLHAAVANAAFSRSSVTLLATCARMVPVELDCHYKTLQTRGAALEAAAAISRISH